MENNNTKLSEKAMFLYLIDACINIQAQNETIISMLMTSLSKTENLDDLKTKVAKHMKENRQKFVDISHQFADTK